ncbi:hypothetical protein SF23_16150 [Streptomyces sp. MBRL 10]|nr:hypothetical protein SF23_16150 [Streptomyces sp. MBRL 10]
MSFRGTEQGRVQGGRRAAAVEGGRFAAAPGEARGARYGFDEAGGGEDLRRKLGRSRTVSQTVS